MIWASYVPAGTFKSSEIETSVPPDSYSSDISTFLPSGLDLSSFDRDCEFPLSASPRLPKLIKPLAVRYQ